MRCISWVFGSKQPEAPPKCDGANSSSIKPHDFRWPATRSSPAFRCQIPMSSQERKPQPKMTGFLILFRGSVTELGSPLSTGGLPHVLLFSLPLPRNLFLACVNRQHDCPRKNHS
jgi:hypothetical protein